MFASLAKLISHRTAGRRRPRARLHLEMLEDRRVLAAFPTSLEQLMLERLNDIRANPAAYGQTIGLDLSNVAAEQPWAFDTRLVEAAHNHAVDMLVRNYDAHTTPEGVTGEMRVRATGFPLPTNQTGLNESIAWQSQGPDIDAVLRGWIIDTWDAPLYRHRLHLLGVTNDEPLVGVGVAVGASGMSKFTIDSASTMDHRPFLTGVVLKDANGSGRYDIGEGVGDVQIRLLQNGAVVATTSTWAAGGYTVQVDAGTYTVEARNSNGQLIAPVQTVTFGAQNIRANFFAVDPTPPPPPPPPPASGAVVAADMGANGVWRFRESSGWEQLSTIDPLRVAAGSDGAVYASFTTGGLQRYTDDTGWVQLATNKPANFVVGANAMILGDYNTGGLWRYNPASGWLKISGSDPKSMQIAADGTAFSTFAGINGVWRQPAAGGAWQKLTGWNASGMALSDNGILTIDFDSKGLWQYTTSGTWVKLTSWNAESIAVSGDGAVIADFGDKGLWRKSGAAAWVQLTTSNPQAIAMNSLGEVLGDFGTAGLWRYTDSLGWIKLHDADVSGLAIG